MVAAEVPDDLLKVDRQFHRFLVDRQMLVPGHASPYLTKTRAGGIAPCTPS
jgi:hypothetical protein